MKLKTVTEKTDKAPQDITPSKNKPVENTLMFSLILAGQTARIKTAEILTQWDLQTGDDAILFAVQSTPHKTESELAITTGQIPRDVYPRVQRLKIANLIANDHGLVLTPKGRAAATDIQVYWNNLDAEFADGLKPKKHKKLRKLFLSFSGI